MPVRLILQAQESNVALQNSTDIGPNQYTYHGFEFAVAVVMLMALGSCCLVTCCNCVRLGASIMSLSSARNRRLHEEPQEEEGPPQRVVSHVWDPDNPADPVFVIQPDTNIGIAYQDGATPRQKPDTNGPAPLDAASRRAAARGGRQRWQHLRHFSLLRALQLAAARRRRELSRRDRGRAEAAPGRRRESSASTDAAAVSERTGTDDVSSPGRPSAAGGVPVVVVDERGEVAGVEFHRGPIEEATVGYCSVPLDAELLRASIRDAELVRGSSSLSPGAPPPLGVSTSAAALVLGAAVSECNH